MGQMTTEEIFAVMEKGVLLSVHTRSAGGMRVEDLLGYYIDAALAGGIQGLRIEGVENVKKTRALTSLPIIGFVKGEYPDGSILITPSIKDIEDLYDAGADIVAIDATKKRRSAHADGSVFFEEARRTFPKLLFADCSTFREGVLAAELGADFVATTLSGYTASTMHRDLSQPDYELVYDLSTSLTVPVIAEGRVWLPEHALRAMEAGAYSVVIGSAITRPDIMVKLFTTTIRGSANG
jgi:N-acylglucosamine-6-phosphate 2-epimerase